MQVGCAHCSQHRALLASIIMCGRITQKSPPDQLGLRIVTGTPDDPRVKDVPPRYNGAPGQEHWVIRQHPKTGERSLDRLWWGLIPDWVGIIGAKCLGTVQSLDVTHPALTL